MSSGILISYKLGYHGAIMYSLPHYGIDSYQHSEGKLRLLRWEGPTPLPQPSKGFLGEFS